MCSFLFFSIQLALIGAPLFSESGYAGIITGVEVIGLERTRQSVTDKAFGKYIGQDAAELDFNDVRASIMETDILEPIEIEIIKKQDGGVILVVTVREKVAILPVPLFMMNSAGEMMAGGVIMDMNAFGINDKFYAGGFYKTGGSMAMASYSHNTRGNRFRGWTVGGNYNRSETELTDQGYYSDDGNQFTTDVMRRYTIDSIRAHFGLSWALTEHISGEADIAFNDKILLESDNDFKPPKNSGMGITFSPALRYGDNEFDGYLMSRRSAYLQYSFMAGINYDNISQLNFRAGFEKPIIPGFKIALNTAAAYSGRTTLLFLAQPQIAPMLPGGYDVFHYAGASAGVEKYIYKIKAGTLSIFVNYQIIETKAPDSDWQFDHGTGGGVVFYLSRIAIPAVAMNVNYNVRRNYFSYSFSVGMGM
jgi:hypothetical protein